MARLVVIGGGAAGMSAASAARRTAPDLEVVVCEAGGFVAYGMCGIPYYLGRTIERADSLLAYPLAKFRDERGIDVRLGTRVTGIDHAARRLALRGAGGTELLSYDVLVVASGADPVLPPVPGIDHGRVHPVRSLDGAIGLRQLLDGGSVRTAIVIGAGYIGLEMAEALVAAGVQVTVIEALGQVLGTVDDPIAGLVQAELARRVRLLLRTGLAEIRHRPRGVTAVLSDGTEADADLMIVAAGIRPASGLLVAAGARHLPGGAIVVDASLRTSLPGVFAAGDCVALPHLVLGRPAWVPLGPAANKTGRIAGTVAAGGTGSFPGVVGTAVVKVFDLEVARTGLGLAEARDAGIAARATDVTSRSRAKYYPGGSPVQVRLVHAPDGLLLGGQLAGREGAAIRIDVLAAALHGRLTVTGLTALDLGYAPPFAPVYDPVLAAAERATRALEMAGGAL